MSTAQRVPCHCTRCAGKLVSPSTFRCHNKVQHSTEFQSFVLQAASELPGCLESVDPDESTEGSLHKRGAMSQMTGEQSQPTKRRRELVEPEVCKCIPDLPKHCMLTFGVLPASVEINDMSRGSVDISEMTTSSEDNTDSSHPKDLDLDESRAGSASATGTAGANPSENSAIDAGWSCGSAESTSGDMQIVPPDEIPDPGCLALDDIDVRGGPASFPAIDDGHANVIHIASPEDMDLEELTDLAHLSEAKLSMKFIRALEGASLEDEGMRLDADTLERLHHPPRNTVDIADPGLHLALNLFLAVGNSSQETYNSVRDAIMRRYPEDTLLSYDRIKRQVAQAVVLSPSFTICVSIAVLRILAHFPNSRLVQSAKKIAHQEFHTIPVGPQLQALCRNPSSATDLNYHEKRTQEILETLAQSDGTLPSYEDLLDGSDYLGTVADGRINSDDIILMLSLDGAQLYRNKASDCWIYIWVVFNHSPDVRYKRRHVLTGGFISGPNKPKNVGSFLFPGLHHLAALQREGLGPGLLYGVLPDKYWKNFYTLVCGIRLINQHKIMSKDLQRAHKSLVQFCIGFEQLYYQRWARLQLPNGQVARSAWNEKKKTLRNVRMAQNVKLLLDDNLCFAEVLFYFQMPINDETKSLALISLYSQPHATLLEASSYTLWSSTSQGDTALRVVDVKAITAVVAMVPHNPFEEAGTQFFVVEKPGLDVAHMGGNDEVVVDNDNGILEEN
ncbi:hypothetical protein SCP_1702260 [Sparassis crispa]|uniref:C2H2-type domain-containing protein n=1 Tax=Sparassis crispa TaxID=139825 RepID=A0A401H6C0_9APHY|nr:hypothetical protein SCP_1702260 [Sparassis crispa]GBE89900.1 hypothetical protein SCP_1702260 [Sparassis crispa]